MLSAYMLKLNLMAPANSLNHNVQNPAKKNPMALVGAFMVFIFSIFLVSILSICSISFELTAQL